MKKDKRNLLALGLSLLLFAFVAKAQWSSDEVLNNVENPKDYNAVVLAQMDRNLSTFANLVALSGLDVSMGTADEFTVFIPTNEAFKNMSVEEFNYLTDPKNKTDLIKFVRWHFLPSKVMKYELKDSQVVSAQSNDEITVSVDEPFGSAYIGDAKIIKSDIEASNGVIHIVNEVIQPRNFTNFGSQESR